MAACSATACHFFHVIALRGHPGSISYPIVKQCLQKDIFYVQVHILRVVLNLACTASWALNGRLVMLLLSRCGEAYELGTQPVRAASQAAASQTLTAFCTFLGMLF